jgi:hypothetical protein
MWIISLASHPGADKDHEHEPRRIPAAPSSTHSFYCSEFKKYLNKRERKRFEIWGPLRMWSIFCEFLQLLS